MPDVSGASAVNTPVHTPTTKRTRGCGCIGHPAFPAPSRLRGPNDQGKTRASVLRDRESVSANPTVIVRQPVRPLAGRMTGSGGRSSIPKTSVIEPRSRGVLDAPPARGMTSSCGAMFANEGDTLTLVVPALDPGIHQSSQERFSPRGWITGSRLRRGFDGLPVSGPPKL
jgi:hypothetical protein